MKQKEKTHVFAPTVIVIFGVTGDLASTRLIPALVDLYRRDLLPERFGVVGFARRPFSREDFRDHMATILKNKKKAITKKIEKFFDRVTYVSGDFHDDDSYQRVSQTLSSIDEKFGMCSNKLFYLAVPPGMYEGIFKRLASSGLTIPCGGDEGWTRVLVEKPFGRDIKTAAHLDKMLGELFKEEQIFRIDHYLAKETMQNILAFRFSNALFEPIWNKDYIERVEIRFLETRGIEKRGELFDSVGNLRDVGQNHVLQMLAVVAMERPHKEGISSIRTERAKALEELASLSASEIQKKVIRAQYVGFTEEKNISPNSQTETYFKVEARIENERWRGVPFLLEAGKGMGQTVHEIVITFRAPHSPAHRNILTFRIQPDEGISILFWAKKPGFDFELDRKVLSFRYKDSRDTKKIPDAYERVLVDAIRGDQTLFASTEEVMAAWKFITPILEHWHSLQLFRYDKGTEGPEI